jgi:sortase (surface protein transpeptidase)
MAAPVVGIPGIRTHMKLRAFHPMSFQRWVSRNVERLHPRGFERYVPILLIALGILIAVAFTLSPRSARKPPPQATRLLPPPGPGAAVRSERVAYRAYSDSARPRRIVIPAIGVSAKVVPLGLNRDGTIQTPMKWGVAGWYTNGPTPGMRGPAVVVGHVDSKSGPAVFYRLRALLRGDLIRIDRGDGTVVRFRVQRSEHWPKSHFPSKRVYGPTSQAALRLVTCGGSFDAATGHYLENTIVYAARI